MSDTGNSYEPQVIEEPGTENGAGDDNIWLRGLWMVVFAILLRFAGLLLGLAALFQFVWMLFNDKDPNKPVTQFGDDVADWMKRVARFQTAATDEKPFPFAKWGPQG